MAMTLKNKQELTITRIFDAPREKAWKAWTDPEEVRKWWGPKDFTAPLISIDLRVGGKFVYCMCGAGMDGVARDFWNIGKHLEIVPMEKIVTTMSFADEQGKPMPASFYGVPGEWPDEIRLTVTFGAIEGGKTKITVQEAGIPGVMLGMAGLGWGQSLDKFADIIVASDHTRIISEPGKQEVIITRVFDAPRNLVFKAYTDPNLIPQWWGPKRFTTIVDKMDVKPGGLWRFVQHDATGTKYAFKGVYHSIVVPERVVDTFEFEGMPGHVSLETATLEEIGGKTRVTTRSVFQTVEDRDGMLESGMEEGVFESMDRFDALLGKLQIGRKAA